MHHAAGAIMDINIITKGKIMTFKKFIATIICTFVVVIAHAQEDWNYSIGLNFRSFSDVEFKAAAVSNPAFPNSFGNVQYINGRATDTDGDGVVDEIVVLNGGVGGQLAPNFYRFDAINGFVPQPGLGSGTLVNIGAAPLLNLTASLDRATFDGAGGGDFDDGAGYVITASRLHKDSGDFHWNFELSLTTAFSDMDQGAGGRITSSDQFVENNSIFIDTNSIDNVILDGGTFARNLGGGTAEGLSIVNNFDMDLSVYTIGAGLSASYEVNTLSLNIGAGPTLTLSDLEVDSALSAVRTGGDLAGRSIALARNSDDSDDFSFGLYVNIGLVYDINESWGFGVEYRYDYVFNDASTDIADVDLDGDSTQVKLIYSF